MNHACGFAAQMRGKSLTCRTPPSNSCGLRPQSNSSGRKPGRWNTFFGKSETCRASERQSRRQAELTRLLSLRIVLSPGDNRR